jgi:ribosome modulation factor
LPEGDCAVIAEDRRAYERAKMLGEQARRNGQKRDACPFRIGTNRVQYDAWQAGWGGQDMALRGRK